jgi:3-hydroxyacyl-CoA dehydrogenase
MHIKTVTVIGANGTMGRNISGIFASFGGATVYMISRDIKNAINSTSIAAFSVKAGSISRRLIPKDYSSLSECIRESDLVYESVSEDYAVKKEVLLRIRKDISKNTIICTGTSGLSVSSLARLLPEEIRANLFGVHLFNPPYSLPLCEFIRSEYSDESVAINLKDYLSKVLLRVVVEVQDSPAFLANRIGFNFINKALRHAEKYANSGGIDYIDAILGAFTGRSMPPLVTADFVGLDVHKAIVDNIHSNSSDYDSDSFVLPKFLQSMIDRGHLGKKSGEGLYKSIKLSENIKSTYVYDIIRHEYRDRNKYHFTFAEKMISDIRVADYYSALKTLVCHESIEADICLSFILQYIVYSLAVSELVGCEQSSADDVMAMGFNWCPPLAFIEAFSMVIDFQVLIKDRARFLCDKVDIARMLDKRVKSKYDFRIYLRAIK